MFLKTRQLVATCVTVVALLVVTGCNNAPALKRAPALAIAPFSASEAQEYQRQWAAQLGIPTSKEVKIDGSTKLELVLIPPGEFMMGSPDGEESRDGDEGRQHRVRITRAFYLGETEVTQGQFSSVMGTQPWKGKRYVREGADYAATYVSWEDAVEFCQRLGAKDGARYRLPTEAEWEYACRAGTPTAYHFGNDASRLGEYAWHDKNAVDVDENYAHRVGQKKVNPFGLSDMHGNVWEWCSDWYGEDYYEGSPSEDPTGPATGSSRVARGGGWDFIPGICRSAGRVRSAPDGRADGLGFRVACSSAD